MPEYDDVCAFSLHVLSDHCGGGGDVARLLSVSGRTDTTTHEGARCQEGRQGTDAEDTGPGSSGPAAVA